VPPSCIFEKIADGMILFWSARLRPVILLCVCLAGIALSSTAQTDPVNFISLTSKDGLSSTIVNSILKDRYGWMWFATEDGLNRFDGNRFTVYRHTEKDSNSLQSNDIASLHEDRTGNIWVGSNEGFLSVYDRKNDIFLNIRSNKGSPKFSANTIKAIYSDHTGNIWLGRYGGISIIDPISRKMLKPPTAIAEARLDFSQVINCFFEDSRHQMWIGTERGLFLYNSQKNSISHFTHSDADPNSIAGNEIKAICPDSYGNIWIGTKTGLSMLLPDGRSFKNIIYQPGNEKTLSSNIIHTIAADPNGQLWIGTEEGLNILDLKSDDIVQIVPDTRKKYSLNRKTVRTIYIDNEGIYWVGSFQGGINKYDKNLNLFQNRQSNAFDPYGLPSPVVTSFAPARNNELFIGTDGGGLSLFNRKTGLFSHIILSCISKTVSDSLTILALEADHKGRLWIGTFNNGLLNYDPSTGSCRLFKKDTSPGSINSTDIFCIKEDSQGKIWIGTNGSGVNVYDPVTDRFHVFSHDPSSPTNTYVPTNGYIRAIIEGEKGRMWIASHGSGVLELDPATNQYRSYNRENTNLPNNVVLSLLKDNNNNIWVGTSGGGLSMLNRQTGSFITYSEKDGLANSLIYKIIQDDNDQLWVSTNGNISSFNLNTKQFKNYSYYNGVQNNNFVLGSGIQLQDGEIFFGGLDGFNHFHPLSLKPNRNVPPVLLTDLRVANQSVNPSPDGPIKEQISIATEINLGYKQNFSLSYTALDYTSAQQNTFAYKLEGFDKDWNYVGRSKTASYTNIDPGNYVFRVKVCNSAGIWSTKDASVIIHIKPPIWRTTYAYVFYFALFIGLLLLYRYKTVQKLKRKFAAEEEKRRIQQFMDDQRKEVEAARELDRLKIKFLTNLSHEFRTPISLIIGPVENILTRGRYENMPVQLQMIRRNARRLLNLVNQLLDFRKMEENELTLHKSDGEVISFIKEAFDSFKDLAERKSIRYEFLTGIKTLHASFDHDKLERILFNLLSNAFKFTPTEGTVRLEIEKKEHASDEEITSLIITVSDTGIGIPADQKKKIFERFFQVNATNILNQGSGIGLSITYEFIKMQGGSIEVESEPGAGSVFRVLLPFSNAAPVSEPDVLQHTQTTATALTDHDDQKESKSLKEDWVEKPSVLLVEDDDDFRFYLKDNLKHYYKVTEARNGKEGWQKALAHHPMLVVSDISMPIIDGIQLINKLKSDKRTSHIPVILLTALTGEAEQLKGLATGANDYMTKPFNFEILNSKIKNLLLLNQSLRTTYSKQIDVHVPANIIESQDAILIKEIRLYIEEHLTDSKLSVDHLSRHVGMSRSSLYAKMLDITGQTPIEYIRAIKLEKAAQLLEKSDLNIAEVAYETGFTTPNYFAKSFKAKYNMLPSEYITLKRKKPAP
jgi:signal transduction histidine kinase/ligand-binding sensor domain-containing protein/DNA-binding response OmpR family regulator